MKNTFRYIAITSLLALASAGTIWAQGGKTYHAEGGVSTAKTVGDQNSDGSYTITLETFATGQQTVVSKGRPVDIVLVLDVSGSMSSTDGNDPYIYSATESQIWTAQNIGSTTYYYKDGDSYYLVYPYDNTLYYYDYGFYELGTTYTGVLYTRMTKLAKMKESVGTFIDIIKSNNDKLNLDPGVKGNQISIVKFAGGKDGDYYGSESNINPGNHKHRYSQSTENNWIEYTSNNFTDANRWNPTEVVASFTEVTASGVTSLTTAVNRLQGGGGTMANNGMTKAMYLMAWLDNTGDGGGNLPCIDSKGDTLRTRVVVLFTDGNPGLTGYNDDTAKATVQVANSLKNTYHCSVYTVGVFGSDKNTKTDAYMNSVSSNEPTATSVGSDNIPHDYYQSASGGLDLEDIFANIAEGVGGENAAIGSNTEVRDVVSNSFSLPIDSSKMSDEEIETWAKENVKVYKVAINENGGSWAKKNEDLGASDEFAGAQIAIDGSKVSVTGFNYGSADNWVGKRLIPGHSGESESDWKWAGNKLVIKFNINAKDGATGGDGTATNTTESGVYTADGVLLNKYDVPHTDLPINLVIKKNGLRHGESATFEIWRTTPIMEVVKDEDGNPIKSKVDPTKDSLAVKYNAIGKPQPDPDKWKDWTKVILTNKGNDGDEVVKTLVSLEPSYIYRIEEDQWGWAYKLEAATEGTLTTSDIEINPFEFTNTEKTDAVKHAEAVSINHFANGSSGSYTEDYSSSKVKSFKTK